MIRRFAAGIYVSVKYICLILTIRKRSLQMNLIGD